MTSYQQRIITYYNRKARPCVFRVGTLILRKVFENTAERGVGKLHENWERPYVVPKVGDLGAYHLQTLDRVPLLHPWNVSNLKQYNQEVWLKKSRFSTEAKVKKKQAFIDSQKVFITRSCPDKAIKKEEKV